MSDAKSTAFAEPHIRTNQLAIRIKHGMVMSVSRKVLHALGNPQYISFWWSGSHRVLLISAETEDTLFSLKVNDRYYKGKTGFTIRKSQFLHAIMKLADWHRNMICVVEGQFIQELTMVAFRLDDAEVKISRTMTHNTY